MRARCRAGPPFRGGPPLARVERVSCLR
jgi:hypothetical protein